MELKEVAVRGSGEAQIVQSGENCVGVIVVEADPGIRVQGV